MERELARNTTLEVNYIGNKGSRLLARQNINQAMPLIDRPACYVDPVPASCLPSNRRPYPNFVTLYRQFLDRALQLQRVEPQV